MDPFYLKNKTILIISPERWGDNFLSKHHYAIELSKLNTVFFLNTLPNPKLNNVIGTKIISKNLTVISYKKNIKGLLKLPQALIDLQFKPVVKQILKEIKEPIDIVWDFDQLRFSNCKLFKAKLNIFHPVDVIKSIPPKIKSRKANCADVIFYLTEEIMKDINSNTPHYFINHGITEDFFNSTSDSSYDFIKKDKINVGYVGNIQSKFLDWNTLKTIVTENLNINFVFIGPYQKSNLGGDNENKDIDFLKTQQNVALVGSRKIKELITILPHFNAFLICYDTSKYRKEVSNSHKLLEYCSTGKVIISNDISTYKKTSNIVEMVENNIDLPLKFKTVISTLEAYNSTKKIDARINFAKQNTYANHLLEIEKIINAIND